VDWLINGVDAGKRVVRGNAVVDWKQVGMGSADIAPAIVK
jgi:hypothetical protein